MRKTDRLKPVLLDVVESSHAKHAGDFADVGGDTFELLAVADFQREVDARVQIVRMAAEGANVRAGLADDGGNVGQHAGPVLRADQQGDGVGGSGRAAPFHIDAAFYLVEQI